MQFKKIPRYYGDKKVTTINSQNTINKDTKDFGIEQWKTILDSLKQIATLSTACIVAFGTIGRNINILNQLTLKLSLVFLVFTIVFSMIAHVFYIATFARRPKRFETFIQGWALILCWLLFVSGLVAFLIGLY